jgi:hypothetical protein
MTFSRTNSNNAITTTTITPVHKSSSKNNVIHDIIREAGLNVDADDKSASTENDVNYLAENKASSLGTTSGTSTGSRLTKRKMVSSTKNRALEYENVEDDSKINKGDDDNNHENYEDTRKTVED